jgi:hypothetical protein
MSSGVFHYYICTQNPMANLSEIRQLRVYNPTTFFFLSVGGLWSVSRHTIATVGYLTSTFMDQWLGHRSSSPRSVGYLTPMGIGPMA